MSQQMVCLARWPMLAPLHNRRRRRVSMVLLKSYGTLPSTFTDAELSLPHRFQAAADGAA